MNRFGGRVFRSTLATSTTFFRCPAGEARGQLGLLAVVVLLSRRGLGLHHLPPRLDDHRPARTETVDGADRLARRAPDGRHDGRRRRDVLLVPRREEPPHHEVVERLLLPVEVPRGRWRRDDGVVVAHLRVVHESRAERRLAGPLREELSPGRLEGVDHPRQRRGHVAREVAAVGARVGDRLLLLVEPLRHLERLLRAPAEEAVRVALQLREVEEERRRNAPRLRLDRLDRRRARLHARDDRGRCRPVLRKAPAAVLLHRRVEPGSPVPPRLPFERRDDLEVLLRNEGADRQLPFDEHRERRRLDAPHRELLVGGQGERAGEVHPDEPVGPAPAARRVGEPVVVPRRLEPREAARGSPPASATRSRAASPASCSRLPRRAAGRSAPLRARRPSRRRPPSRAGRRAPSAPPRTAPSPVPGRRGATPPAGSAAGRASSSATRGASAPARPARRGDRSPTSRRAPGPPGQPVPLFVAPEHRRDVPRDGRLLGDDGDKAGSGMEARSM